MESNNKKDIRLHIEGMEYPIDQDTATKLQEGICSPDRSMGTESKALE